jgi:RNA-directed DNA polymerase
VRVVGDRTRWPTHNTNNGGEKTKLVKLADNDEDQGEDTFDFLGFTHYMSKSRKGKPILKRKTSRKKLRGALVRMNKWIKENRHSPFLEGLIADLNRKLRGDYQYYGVTFNSRQLVNYYERVKRMLFKWVNRRGAREHLTWERFALRINVWSPLEKPKIYHKFF